MAPLQCLLYLLYNSSHLWLVTQDPLLRYSRCTNAHSCPRFLSSNPDVDPKTTSSDLSPPLWHTHKKTYTSENTTTCLFIKDGIDTNGLNRYQVALGEPPCPLLFNIEERTSERMGWRDTHVRHYITTCGCTAAFSSGQGSTNVFQLWAPHHVSTVDPCERD